MSSILEQKNTDSRIQDRAGEGGTLFELLGIAIVLVQYRRLIILAPIVIASIALLVSLALPNIYQASTKLMPPQQSQSGTAALLAQLGGVAGAVSGAAGLKNPSDLYIGMLKSRTIADNLVKKFALQKVYEEDSLELARKQLADNTTIAAGKDGLILIQVEDRSPKLATDLANAYVAELLELTKVLAITEAAKRRIFFGRELETAKNQLANAEVELKRALDTDGVISVDSDSRAIVETVARLRAQISVKEVELNSMRPFVTETHPDYRRAQEELSSQRAELNRLQNGRTEKVTTDPRNPASENGLQNIKILRDLKYYQMLYELLAKQYEGARLEEAKDPAVIQVLDPAIQPERKFKPKRAIIVLVAAFLGLIFAIGWAFLRDAAKKLESQPQGAPQLEKLKSSWRRR